jgi:hypothetical protein
MAAFCHRCGHPLLPEAQFCKDCGAPISQAEPAPATLVTDEPQRLIRDKRIHSQIKYWVKVLWPFAIGIPLLIWFLQPGAPENSATQSAAPSTAPEKPVPPLDYGKQVYTTEDTLVCLTASVAGDAEGNIRKDSLNCSKWPAGVPVAARPMNSGDSDSYAVFSDWNTPGGKYYASPDDLTNDPKGAPRSVNSSPAPQPESQAQPESQPVAAKPVPPLDWNKPIYTTANALVCKLSRMESSLGKVDMDVLFQKLKHNGKAAEDFIGCTEYSAGILVTAIPWPPAIAGTSSGIATFPNNPPSYNDYIVRIDDLTNDAKGAKR